MKSDGKVAMAKLLENTMKVVVENGGFHH